MPQETPRKNRFLSPLSHLFKPHERPQSQSRLAEPSSRFGDGFAATKETVETPTQTTSGSSSSNFLSSLSKRLHKKRSELLLSPDGTPLATLDSVSQQRFAGSSAGSGAPSNAHPSATTAQDLSQSIMLRSDPSILENLTEPGPAIVIVPAPGTNDASPVVEHIPISASPDPTSGSFALPSSSSSFPSPSTVRTGVNLAKGGLNALSSFAEGIPIPGVKGIIDTVIKVINVVETTGANQEALEDLRVHCSQLMDIFAPLEGKAKPDISDELQVAVTKAESELETLLIAIDEKSKVGKLVGAINHADISAMIDDMRKKMVYHLQVFSISVNVLSALKLENVEKHVLNQALLNIPHAKAGFDYLDAQPRVSCFEGTRKNLLDGIKAWLYSTNIQHSIYVLYGIAGIGKTTVAQTIAEYAAKQHILGASFFFTRAEEDRRTGNLFFGTLAFQLGNYFPVLGHYIGAAVLQDPDCSQKQLHQQIQHLLVEPIEKSQLGRAPILLVIDAMDECVANHAKIILELFARNIHALPQFKILITARPEPYIDAVFSDKPLLQPFYLHEVEKSIAQEDIRQFLTYALSKDRVKKVWPQSEWKPTKEHIDILSEKCGILFIMASTVVQHILNEDVDSPQEQLEELITDLAGGDNLMNSLDVMYQSILRLLIPNRKPWIYFSQFQKVLGSIVSLEDPLPMKYVAKLLDMTEEKVRRTIKSLHSIIAPNSKTDIPQLYHKSFYDFITNPKQCTDTRFCLVPSDCHAKMAICCFKVMNKGLHENMLNLRGTEKYMENAEMLKATKEKIPEEIKYSCLYWATHLTKIGNIVKAEPFELLEVFLYTHALHWIEVLSLIGKLDVAYSALVLAEKALANSMFEGSKDMKEMLYDIGRCVMRSYVTVKDSAMHIYYSAFPFVPKATELYKYYASEVNCVKVMTTGEKHWNPLLGTMTGHLQDITCVAFSVDGSRLASGSGDCTVRLWDGHTGAHIETLDRHHQITCIAFSPDGSRLVSGSHENSLGLWDGHTGAYITSLHGHKGHITCVAFSADGLRLVSGSADSTLRLWDVQTETYIVTLNGHVKAVTSVAFSANGSNLVSGSEDNTIKLWEGYTGAHVATLNGHLNAVTCVAFAGDGSKLASGSKDNTVRLWNGYTGAYIATLNGHSKGVTSVVFSADGLKLASGSWDHTIRLWNGHTGAYFATLDGHSYSITCFAFSSDGSRLASGSGDTTIRLWDGNTGAHIATLYGHLQIVTCVAFSADGSKLASGSWDKTVRLWNGYTGAHVTNIVHHLTAVTAVAFSADVSKLACQFWDNTMSLWDGYTGAYIATIDSHLTYAKFKFSADGLKLACIPWDNTVRLWNGHTGAQIATLNHLGHVKCVAFSSDGSKMASGSYDRTVRLWDGYTGAYIAALDGHLKAVSLVTFSTDGSRLASGSEDGTVRLWSGYTGANIATLDGHLKGVECLAFSANGSKLASGSWDNTVRLWHGYTGAYIATLDGHLKAVLSVAFSSDGSTLASRSIDRTVRLWNGHSGALIEAQQWPHDSMYSSEHASAYPFESISFSARNGGIFFTAGNICALRLPSDLHLSSEPSYHGFYIALGTSQGSAFLLNTRSLVRVLDSE